MCWACYYSIRSKKRLWIRCDMDENVIEIVDVKKKYKLGEIGGGTLRGDLQSLWARMRHKEDPNTVIGTDTGEFGDEFYALDGINLKIKQGETVGIIGHNGAGKSTLLKLLSRVTAPTEGEIYIKGRIASMLEVGTGFHPELTGRENIYMNGAILGMTKAEIDARIEDIIDFSECRQFIDTPVKRYSSGMYVKLAFSVAAHLDAEILIMDEVLAVGDVKFQKKCLGKMDYEAHEGKTVLYVSHNMSTIRQLCTRCIVLNHGKVIFDGDVEKAIEYYIGAICADEPGFIDLSESKRPDGFGTSFKLKSVDFVGRDEAIFYDNEKIAVDIEWESHRNYESLYLRFEVVNLDQSPVGMAESEELLHIEENTTGTWHFEWDASNLAEGKYQITLDTYIKNDMGSYWSYDHPYQKVNFEILDSKDDSKKSLWNRNAWNSVRLNEIVLKK